MQMAMKRTLVLLLLFLTLLSVLASGILRGTAGVPEKRGHVYSHQMAAFCPGPPFGC